MVWYMQSSWHENVGTWFSISTVCSPNHVVGIPDICNVKEEWVEHGIDDHEVRDGNDV